MYLVPIIPGPLLVPLVLAAVFFLLAYYCWRLRYRYLLTIPLLCGSAILALTVAIKVQDVQRTQARKDADLLLAHLNHPALWRITDMDNADRRLLLASTASQALWQTKAWYPERDSAINATLRILAGFAANPDRLPNWNRRTNWEEETFFLAHAGATLAHYELATNRDDRAGEMGLIANHLGTHLPLTQYKHLPSHPEETFFRPADNAAAIYALSLLERLGYTDRYGPVSADWSNYLQSELYYQESRLPCAAFSPTNRCQLEPSAAATGLYVGYRAAAQRETADDIPYREWLHYFKSGVNTPFGLQIKQDMRRDKQTRFCNLGAAPLKCGRYEQDIGLWLAALYDGDYTYFRLFSTVVISGWLHDTADIGDLRPAQRAEALQKVTFRLLGESL